MCSNYREDLTDHIPGIEEDVLSEHRVHIFAGEYSADLVCTRSEIRELACGHLAAEGIIECADDIKSISISNDETGVTVCVCDRTLEREARRKPPAFIPFDSDLINRLSRQFLCSGVIHEKTFATHTAGIVKDGEFVCVFEDISRHCAIDKAIGYSVLSEIDMSSCMLFTTGRVQEETVKKVINAGIPMIVSKTVATKQAIEVAWDNDITLIGKARGDSLPVCYSCTAPKDCGTNV